MAAWLEPAAEALAVACDIAPGTTVLDVAAGTGNFAVAAATRGAEVTATDLTPSMIERGRDRTASAGLAVEWMEADAEDLPFETGRFEITASVFGAMFATPDRVAAELFRVTRPGGRVAMANYASDGFAGRMAELVVGFSPSRSWDGPSPLRWGEPGEVRARFASLATDVRTERRSIAFRSSSLEEGWTTWERTNPVHAALRELFPAAMYTRLRDASVALMRDLNRSDDGGLVLDSTYLLVVATAA